MALKVVARKSGLHGRGLFAARDLQAGEKLIEYTGKRYGKGEHPEMNDDGVTKFLGLSDGTGIDGTGWAALANHGCDPNCELQEEETPRGKLRAWLFAVMHGVFINGTRRRRPAESLDALEDSAPERADDGASAETSIAVRELREALLRLPDEQRQVVLLVGLEQFSYAEAADVLEVPIGTVMSRLARGRERLRQLLEEGTSDRHGLRRVK